MIFIFGGSEGSKAHELLELGLVGQGLVGQGLGGGGVGGFVSWTMGGGGDRAFRGRVAGGLFFCFLCGFLGDLRGWLGCGICFWWGLVLGCHSLIFDLILL